MQIKTRLNSRFKMTDLGKLSWFLGIQFECENYIKKLLSKFSMADCKPRPTPYEMDITKTSDEVNLIESKKYIYIFFTFFFILICISFKRWKIPSYTL